MPIETETCCARKKQTLRWNCVVFEVIWNWNADFPSPDFGWVGAGASVHWRRGQNELLVPQLLWRPIHSQRMSKFFFQSRVDIYQINLHLTRLSRLNYLKQPECPVKGATSGEGDSPHVVANHVADKHLVERKQQAHDGVRDRQADEDYADRHVAERLVQHDKDRQAVSCKYMWWKRSTTLIKTQARIPDSVWQILFFFSPELGLLKMSHFLHCCLFLGFSFSKF